jgi:hypothetical protein
MFRAAVLSGFARRITPFKTTKPGIPYSRTVSMSPIPIITTYRWLGNFPEQAKLKESFKCLAGAEVIAMSNVALNSYP